MDARWSKENPIGNRHTRLAFLVLKKTRCFSNNINLAFSNCIYFDILRLILAVKWREEFVEHIVFSYYYDFLIKLIVKEVQYAGNINVLRDCCKNAE